MVEFLAGRQRIPGQPLLDEPRQRRHRGQEPAERPRRLGVAQGFQRAQRARQVLLGHQLLARAAAEELRAPLRQLTRRADERDVLAGHTLVQTAGRLNLPEGTLKSRVRAAYADLRTTLAHLQTA